MISSGFIKSIQNEMRKDDGVDGDAQRLSQLVWLIFLKVLDDDEHQKEFLDKNYKPAVPEKYRWKTWASSDDGLTGEALLEFVNNDMFPALKNLEIDPTNRRTTVVKEVFANSFNYMKNGTQLRKVINKINLIDFNSSEDRHSFGDIYETLLASLQSAGNAGEFYTPRAITKFIVEMVNPRLGEKVFDPAAGTGGFLTGAIDLMRKEVKTPEDEQLLQKSIHGIEKKQLPYTLLVTNMIFHGLEEPAGIRHDNTLARPLISYGPDDFVDVIAANPPFGGSEEDGIEDNFPSSFRTRETADLFLVLFVRLLKNGGRAGIVLPDNTLFGDGVKNRIKEYLLNECNLHTIIRLPKTVFSPYASLATNLLFFTKGEPTKEIWYYEHRLPEGVKAYNKTKPIRLEEFNPIKEWWDKREENDVAWKVSIEEIRERDYNLDIKNPRARDENEFNPRDILESYRSKWNKIDSIADKLKSSLHETLDNHSNEDIRYLTDNLHEYLHIANAAKLLRKNILHLSVSGQLVPQKADEGTAESLYKKIQSEKVKATGKKSKQLPEISENELPFDIPASWMWVRLGEITNYGSSEKIKSQNINPETWVLELEDIEKSTSKLLKKVTASSRVTLSDKNMFYSGDVLYGKLRPYLDKVIVANEDGVCTGEILPIRAYGRLVNPLYLQLCLKSPSFIKAVNELTYGVKMPRLGTEDGRKLLLPLPPFDEQERIVQKTSELIGLVAELEKHL